jgi:hypothetical protein
MSTLRLAFALTVAAFVALGCRSRTAPRPAASESARAKPPPAPRPAPSAVAPKPAPVGCRVLAVKGAGAGAPSVGELLDGHAFFELPAGAELDVRHSQTTRELALRGPGRFRACPRGEELVIVTRGRVSTTSGPGARAGAEVQLATPFGVVHFGDAALHLDVTEQKVDLAVTQGFAVIDGRTKEDGPTQTPVSGPRGQTTFRGRTDPKALVAGCVKSATGLPSPTPAASAPNALGQWAVERLKARQTARYACSRALSAVGLVEGPEADRLWDLVAAKIAVTGSGAPGSGAPEK